MPGFPRQCLDGNGLTYRDAYASRGYCDRCIMTGIAVTKAQGLIGLDVYARSMGVSIDELVSAHPEWRP